MSSEKPYNYNLGRHTQDYSITSNREFTPLVDYSGVSFNVFYRRVRHFENVEDVCKHLLRHTFYTGSLYLL